MKELKILIIADLPKYDRSSAGLRLYSILKILSTKHQLTFYATDYHGKVKRADNSEIAKYWDALEKLGIIVKSSALNKVLMSDFYDAVLMEYYYVANSCIKTVRRWQPGACIFADSVDVVFNRLQSKANITRVPEDLAEAHNVKEQELSAYRQADVTIAVTENDKQVLLSEDPNLSIEIIPNIHKIHNVNRHASKNLSIVFVGTFVHEPNVDAMLYFCKEVWPHVCKAIPDAQLKIVGAYPTPEIKALSSESIKVTGFVPDVLPHLQDAWISIAPLRFGAGMKGKIGEAMAAGLPVVSTSVGIEGMGLTPNENVLVADTASEFAKTIVRLFQDKNLYERISKNGKNFIEADYSFEAVNDKVLNIFKNIDKHKPIPRRFWMDGILRFLGVVRYQADRYLLWRLK